MATHRRETNPYELLGVERDASAEQISEAFRRRKFEASRTDPSLLRHIDVAFTILKDPDRRKKLTQTLFNQEILEAVASESTQPRAVDKRPVATSWVKSAILAVLMVVLGVTAFLALGPQDDLCPQCERWTVSARQLDAGRVEYSCSRTECDFTYKYDPAADVDEAQDAHAVKQPRVTE